MNKVEKEDSLVEEKKRKKGRSERKRVPSFLSVDPASFAEFMRISVSVSRFSWHTCMWFGGKVYGKRYVVQTDFFSPVYP